MNRRRRMLLAALGCSFVALGGCGGVGSLKKQNRARLLEEAVDNYGKMIRWGYLDEAAGYLRARDGSRIEGDLARVARYRVTGYDTTNRLLADNGSEARVVARIEYYEIDSGVLRELRDEQFWWYDEDIGRWYLGSSLPAFGASRE